MSKHIFTNKANWIFIGAAVFMLAFSGKSFAKEWRGITPLKSTRADVERLLGASETNFYKFETERAWIFYGIGDSKGDNCVSKAPKDVVTRISVLPEDEMLLQNLNLDLTKFRKTRSFKFSNLITYYNENDGISYEVDKKENNDITDITYYPSREDCEEMMQSSPQSVNNEWRGITPLKSTRADVERLLGKSETDFYKFDTERAWIFYSSGDSKTDNCIGKAPKDVVTRISVMPEEELPLKSLNLNLSEFKTTKNLKYHLIIYHNEEEGVIYEVAEEDNDITHITYYPTKEDCEEIMQSSPQSVNNDKWRGIIPLKSTRADVERLLCKPNERD